MFNKKIGQKGRHKSVQANPNVKGGIKVGSLGLLEISKAKWHWNSLHKLCIVKEKESTRPKRRRNLKN